MKKHATIEINKVKYPIKYGYGTTKLLGKQWGLPGLMEVFQKVLQMLPGDPEKVDLDNIDLDEKSTLALLSFDNIDMMAEITLAGLLHGGAEDDLFSPDDIAEFLLSNMDAITIVFGEFMASMPKPKEPVKAVQKKRVTRKKPPMKKTG